MKKNKEPKAWDPFQETYAKRDETLLKIGFASYTDYLASELWLKIRTRVINKTQGKCLLCKEKATEVHHLGYGMETLLGRNGTALIPICSPCHHAIEFDRNGMKRTLKESQRAYQKKRRRMKRLPASVLKQLGRCIRCGRKAARRADYCRPCSKRVGLI